ncbi:MAG: hypothetical protein JXA10_12340 [Anaerolineae bacterium]|nr:hypothetical protein [Anaerolineae bacterium]
MTSRSKPVVPPPPIYIWLFAAYPILEIYAQNIGLLAAQDMLIALGVAWGVVTIIFLVLQRRIKNPTRAPVITLLLIALFFSYGHIYNVVLQWLDRSESLHLVCFPAALLVFGGALYVAWQKSRVLYKAAAYLNLTAIILVAFPVAKIADFIYYEATAEIEDLPVVTLQPNASAAPPDVYYIILDGYSRADWLETWYGFDNTAFLDELTARGFYVADRSCSNYIQTQLSLPSGLSMAYINPANAGRLTGGKGGQYLRSYIKQNNRVVQAFRSLGYTTIHFATHFSITAYNPGADVLIDFGPSGSFVTTEGDATDRYWNALLPTTLYSPFFTYDDVLKNNTYSPWNPHRVLMSLAELKAIATRPEPTFTFAHIIKPHDPYSFDRAGNIVDDLAGWIPETDIDLAPDDQRYIEQVLFVNTQILDVIDTILAASDEPPIIVIQADHAWDGRLSLNSTPRIERFPILNAYLVPDVVKDQLYPSISPVNSFRVIFDAYWGTDLGLLEDASYASKYEKPFAMTPLSEEMHATWCAE